MEQKYSKKNLSSDLAALLIGFFLVALVVGANILFQFDAKAVKFSSWQDFSEIAKNFFQMDFLVHYIVTGLVLTTLLTLAHYWMGKEGSKSFAQGFMILYLLAGFVYFLAAQKTMKQYLEYAFWALLIGLLLNNIFRLPACLKSALQSSFFIKIGLVIMGTEVIFSNITRFGLYGVAISWIVVPIVIIFMWNFGVKVLKIQSHTLVMVMAVATSVCGVSAAVAAAAAIRANKEDLTFSVGVSMMFTIAMMVLMPLLIKALGISELIGGAWIGNTVDSTGAVVLAGEALGPIGSQIAAIIKMIQNVLIGAIVFIISVFFAKKDSELTGDSVSVKVIWDRFPKFVLGFVMMSLIFSFLIQPNLGVEVTNHLVSLAGSWKGWFFCLTFLSIGLETNFKELFQKIEGGKPVTLYVVGQSFSMVLSLLICWLVLSGIVFPAPEILSL